MANVSYTREDKIGLNNVNSTRGRFLVLGW